MIECATSVFLWILLGLAGFAAARSNELAYRKEKADADKLKKYAKKLREAK